MQRNTAGQPRAEQGLQPSPCLESALYGAQIVETFLEKIWERKPRVFSAGQAPGRAAFFQDLCNLRAFKRHVEGVAPRIAHVCRIECRMHVK